MSGFQFGSSASSSSASSQSTTSPFSFSNPPTTGFSLGSSASPFGSTTPAFGSSGFSFAPSSSSPSPFSTSNPSSAPPASLGFGSSTTTTTSPAPSFSFAFNSTPAASTTTATTATSAPPSSSLFGAPVSTPSSGSSLFTASASTTTSPFFGTTPSSGAAPTSASPLFGTPTTTSPLFGSTPTSSPFGTALSAPSSSPFLTSLTPAPVPSPSPAFSFASSSAPNSTTASPFLSSSSSGMSFSTASAFSKLTPTPSPTTTPSANQSSSSTTPSAFSFLQSSSSSQSIQSSFAFANLASSAAPVSTTPATKPTALSLGTSTSAAPLFSTVTTTSASTPVTTTTTTQGSFSVPPFGFSSSTTSVASLTAVPASLAAPSGTTTNSFTGFGVTSTPASSGTTGFSFSKQSTPASSSQAQSTTAAPVFRCPFSLGETCIACSAKLFRNCVGDGGEGVEGERVRDEIVKKSMLPNAVTVEEESKVEVILRVRKDQNERREVVEMKVACAQEGFESSEEIAKDSVPGNVVSFPTIISAGVSSMSLITDATVVTPEVSKPELSNIGSEWVMLLGKEVEGCHKEALTENDLAAAASKAFPVDDTSANGLAVQTLTSLCVEVDRRVRSPHNGPIIKSILYKYGDITIGSRFRSMDAKLAFLELMADAVYRLSNLTFDTVSSHELQLIEANVADVLDAGFNVKWLQQRVDEVIEATKYEACCQKLNELDQQIEATKKSLMDMEQRRVVLARGVVAIKAQIEGKGILGCTLAEGLL